MDGWIDSMWIPGLTCSYRSLSPRIYFRNCRDVSTLLLVPAPGLRTVNAWHTEALNKYLLMDEQIRERVKWMDMGLWKAMSATDQQREGKGFRKQKELCGQKQKSTSSAGQLAIWDQNPWEEVREEHCRQVREGLPCRASFAAALKINKWKASTPSWTCTATLWNNLHAQPEVTPTSHWKSKGKKSPHTWDYSMLGLLIPSFFLPI